MLQLEIDEMIKCPIDQVFARLADISAYSQWLPPEGIFVSTRQLSQGPIGVGTTYRDRTTLGTFRGEVIEFQRPTKIVFKHRLHWLGIPVLETCPGYILEATEGGTKLHHTAKGRLFGIFRLIRPRANHIARKERKRTVAELKASLESLP